MSYTEWQARSMYDCAKANNYLKIDDEALDSMKAALLAFPDVLEALEELKYSISFRTACLVSGDASKIAYADDKMWKAHDKAGTAIAKAKGEQQ